MSAVPTMSREACEIREIERDLTNLQRHYGVLDRSAKRARLAFRAFLIVLVALIVAGAMLGKPGAAVASTLVLIVVLLMAYSLRERRWIDLMGWFPPGTWSPLDLVPPSIKQTEAEAIETMVAERVARLGELRGERT